MTQAPDSLRALLESVVDYAGLYPPAGLPLSEATADFEAYRASPAGWMLNRLVLPYSQLNQAALKDGWRVTLLVEDEPGPLPPAVESLETKSARKLSLPTYCEAPLECIHGAFAKIRTGGVTADAIPRSDLLASLLFRAANLRLPFKATAGLHHPVRNEYPLTYAADSPKAVMHGFLNFFVAASFAWFGLDQIDLAGILNEEDVRAFQFLSGELRYRDLKIETGRIRSARREFAHSFGSCSFVEPVAGLRELGLIS